MAEKPKELYTVTSRTKIAARPGMADKTITIAVSYVAPGLAPHTLFIPEDKWSPEEEKKLILAAIKERAAFKPEIVTE